MPLHVSALACCVAPCPGPASFGDLRCGLMLYSLQPLGKLRHHPCQALTGSSLDLLSIACCYLGTCSASGTASTWGSAAFYLIGYTVYRQKWLSQFQGLGAGWRREVDMFTFWGSEGTGQLPPLISRKYRTSRLLRSGKTCYWVLHCAENGRGGVSGSVSHFRRPHCC